MPRTLESAIRTAAVLWVKEASMDELTKIVPMRYLRHLTTANSPSAVPFASRMVKKMNHRLSEEEKEKIRGAMQGLARGTPPYRMQVKHVSHALRVSPRQIGSVMSEVARKRKKEATP